MNSLIYYNYKLMSLTHKFMIYIKLYNVYNMSI